MLIRCPYSSRFGIDQMMRWRLSHLFSDIQNLGPHPRAVHDVASDRLEHGNRRQLPPAVPVHRR